MKSRRFTAVMKVTAVAAAFTRCTLACYVHVIALTVILWHSATVSALHSILRRLDASASGGAPSNGWTHSHQKYDESALKGGS